MCHDSRDGQVPTDSKEPVKTRAAARQIEPTSDNYALGYAQRCAWIFGSWWYGAILAASGAAYVLASTVTGHHPGTGTVMAVLGLAIAGLGWLASAPKRFTRKRPKPALDVHRAEQAIRINPGIAIGSNALMIVILVTLAFATPRGTAPDVVPILVMMSVFAPMAGIALLRVRAFLVNRQARYAHWLARGATS